MSTSLNFKNYNPIPGETKSGRYRYTNFKLDHHANKILNRSIQSKSKSGDLEGQGTETVIIPSDLIEIHTRLEVLFGLKLSGHFNTLTEASHLIDEICK